MRPTIRQGAGAIVYQAVYMIKRFTLAMAAAVMLYFIFIRRSAAEYQNVALIVLSVAATEKEAAFLRHWRPFVTRLSCTSQSNVACLSLQCRQMMAAGNTPFLLLPVWPMPHRSKLQVSLKDKEISLMEVKTLDNVVLSTIRNVVAELTARREAG